MVKSLSLLLLMSLSLFPRASNFILYQIDRPLSMDGNISGWSESYLLDTLRPERNTASHYTDTNDSILHGDIHARLYGGHDKDTIFLAVEVTRDDYLNPSGDGIIFGPVPLFNADFSIKLSNKVYFSYAMVQDFYKIGENFFSGVTCDAQAGSAVFEWSFVKYFPLMMDSLSNWSVTYEDVDPGHFSCLAFGSDFGFIRCPTSWSAPCFHEIDTTIPAWRFSDSLPPVRTEEPRVSASPATLRAFPNPFSRQLTVQTPADALPGVAELLDINGRRVARRPCHGPGVVSWDTSRLPEGLYVVQWRRGSDRLRLKCLLVK